MSLPTKEQIEQVARDVLRELVGEAPADAKPEGLARSLVSEADVRAARANGESVILVQPGTIVTPLARDAAQDNKIEIRVATPQAPAASEPADGGPAPLREGGPVALGADHGGFALKQALLAHLEQRGVSARDLGTTSKESCDYPDFAGKVATAVAMGEASWGILVDGAGIGSCMAANKVPGVLAATCHDERTARNSREHNGANVLCLGTGSLDEAGAKRVVDAWLETPFGGGRHARRVNKIKAIERSFVR